MSARSMSKKTASFAIALCAAVLLGNGAARADEGQEPAGPAKKHAEAMSQGKNHEEARDATARPVYANSVQALTAKRHAEAMSRGMNHEEARDATAAPVDAAQIQARSMRHVELMNKGAIHEQDRADIDHN